MEINMYERESIGGARCGLSVDGDGVWRTEQLFTKLSRSTKMAWSTLINCKKSSEKAAVELEGNKHTLVL